MIFVFSIFAMMFLWLGLLYNRRKDRDGSMLFMFIISGWMQALTLLEVVNLVKG